jgi:deoxyguanosine kinase
MSFYVGIEGAPGVGKTTLSHYASGAFGMQLILEAFEENPFLKLFHEDRDRYAFHAQLFFLMSRYEQNNIILHSSVPTISDYIFAKDALFARANLQGDELLLYERISQELIKQTRKPDLVIFLRAATDELVKRIRRRGRSSEQTMEREFIKRMQEAYERFFASYTTAPVVVIDTTELNIVDFEQDRCTVLGVMRDAINELAKTPPPDLGEGSHDHTQ